jgi:WD40 repeat protein
MPDGLRILIREGSGVRIFDLEKMKDETVLQAPQELVTAALSPDGELLAWSLADSSIQLIRLADGHLLKTMKAHTLQFLKLRFSSTGDRLFSASYDTWIRVWDRNGNVLDAIQPTAANDLPNDIQGIGISPDGRLLGSIPFDGPAKIYDLTTKKEVVNLGGTGGDVISDIDFSPDGEFVAADQLERLTLWRTSDWEMEWTGIHSMAFAFSPDGRFLAYADAEDYYNVHFRSLAQSEETRRLEGDGSVIWDMFFSPDGRLLTGVGAGLQIWGVDSGELLYVGKAACP